MSEKLNSGEQIQDNGELNEWEEAMANAPEFSVDNWEVSKPLTPEEKKQKEHENSLKDRLNSIYDEPYRAGAVLDVVERTIWELGGDDAKRLLLEQYDEYTEKEASLEKNTTFEEQIKICNKVEEMIEGIVEKLQEKDGLSYSEASNRVPYDTQLWSLKADLEFQKEYHPEKPVSLEAMIDKRIKDGLSSVMTSYGPFYRTAEARQYSTETIEGLGVIKDYVKIAKGEAKPLDDYALINMDINKYSPRYLDLAESSLDRDAQEKIKELREHDAAAADEIIEKVAYSGKEEGKFYDVCVDKETGELLLGEDADRAREREVTRWMEGEGQRKYGEEYGKISEPIINYVERTLDIVSELTKAAGLNGPNDYAPVLYRGRVRQNIANGLYRNRSEEAINSVGGYPGAEVRLVSSYGDTVYESGAPVPTSEEQEDWDSDMRLDNPNATNWLEITRRNPEEDRQAGIQPDSVWYSRYKLREIDLYGMPLKETRAWKENMKKLDPELKDWISRAESMIERTTCGSMETVALRFELNRKIAEGAFNGKRVVEVQNGPGRSPFRIEDIETTSTVKDAKSFGKKKFMVKKKKLA